MNEIIIPKDELILGEILGIIDKFEKIIIEVEETNNSFVIKYREINLND